MLRSEGNPYHAADGKFASGPGGGGHGKHTARNRRRRQRRREKLRAKWHAEAQEMKRDQRIQRKELLRDQHAEWKQLEREHKTELHDVNKAWSKDRAKLKAGAASGTMPKTTIGKSGPRNKRHARKSMQRPRIDMLSSSKTPRKSTANIARGFAKTRETSERLSAKSCGEDIAKHFGGKKRGIGS